MIISSSARFLPAAPALTMNSPSETTARLLSLVPGAVALDEAALGEAEEAAEAAAQAAPDASEVSEVSEAAEQSLGR